ncbi:hypothetical protein QEN19_002721 [Hanseniaspora menglaensis]
MYFSNLKSFNKSVLRSQQKTALLQHKRTGFFDFMGRGKSDEDEKKDLLNNTLTKEDTRELAESLVKGENAAAVDSKTEIKVLDMKNIRVIGDETAHKAYLKNLKEHRIFSMNVNEWQVKEQIKSKEFEKFETILKDLLLKHKLKLNDLSIPFTNFQTKFLFSKEIQAQTGISLSDYNVSIFKSPKDYKTFFYEVVLSGELFKYQEKKPLAITLDIVADADHQTDKEIALKRLEAEFFDTIENDSIKYREFNSEYQELVDSMIERTKIFRPVVNNVRVKTFRNYKDQSIMKKQIKDEIEYSNIKSIGSQSLAKN